MKDDDEGAKMGIILVEQSGLAQFIANIFAVQNDLQNICYTIIFLAQYSPYLSPSQAHLLHRREERQVRYVFSSATHFLELRLRTEMGRAGHAHWFAGNAEGELFAIPSDPTEEKKCAIRLPRKSSKLFLEIMKVEHGD